MSKFSFTVSSGSSLSGGRGGVHGKCLWNKVGPGPGMGFGWLCVLYLSLLSFVDAFFFFFSSFLDQGEDTWLNSE